MMRRTNYQQGAVSLFIVLFSALLLSVIAMSFTRLMISDQQQATISDVSQSAYDSAVAGVEDAKRALLFHQACQNGTQTNTDRCRVAKEAFSGGETSCTILSDIGVSNKQSNGETYLQTTLEGDASLEQAYTCVKLNPRLTDYLSIAKADTPIAIPITINNPSSSTMQLKLSWVSRQDFSSDSQQIVGLQPSRSNPFFPTPSQWSSVGGDVKAPLMELGLTRSTSGSIRSTDFNGSNTDTFYLYPGVSGNKNPVSFERRFSGTKTPKIAYCKNRLTPDSNGYACQAYITIPGGTKTLFAKLIAIYSSAHFSIEILNNGTPTVITTPQVEVDSMGRASNLYRRVISRIETSGEAIYPNAALNVGGGSGENSVCKDFVVTSSPSQHAKGCGDY